MRPLTPPGEQDQASVGAADARPAFTDGFGRGVLVTLVLLGVLIAAGVAHMFLAPQRKGLTDFFFIEQDLFVAGVMSALLIALAFPWPWRFALRPPPASWRTALLLALAVAVVGWAGSYLVYDDYALSMDEFMARFDAQILASGHLAAPVPPQWREYVKALQPLFMLDIPGHAYWVSNYLPVNAAFLALGLKLGVMNLVPALWAGIGVIATFGVARRIWPEKPGAALVAAALLATSPQLLVTAMTPYAMSAHLALNMVWLWLYLRGGRLGHGLAAPVAFLATGLHQLVFHPLFAAPFVLELWLAKRWKPALWHTAAYAVIGAFWALYQPMLVHFYGAGTVAQAAEGHGAVASLGRMLALFEPTGLGYIAKNLLRFLTWQNLLLAPLLLAALAPAIRCGGVLRAMVLSIALTLSLVLVVMPYQGHGWGYRYLHGLMGAACVLAGWHWTKLAEDHELSVPTRRAVFASGIAASVLLLFPIRAAQAHMFEHPYSVAFRQIVSMKSEVVIVDPSGLWFGADLIRNEPSLTRAPIALAANEISLESASELCSTSIVGVYSSQDAVLAGVRHGGGLRGSGAASVIPTSCDSFNIIQPLGTFKNGQTRVP